MDRTATASPTGLHSRVFEALHALAVATGGVLDQAALAKLAADHIRELLGFDVTALYWWDSSMGLLLPMGASDPTLIPPDGVAPGAGTIGLAFSRGEPVIVDDYATWENALPWAVASGVRSTAAVPLLVDNRALGSLVGRSYTGHHFTAEEVEIMTLVAAQVAPALEAARLHAEAKTRAAEALNATAHLQAVLDAVPGPISWVSADRTYLGVNRYLSSVFGMEPSEFVGRRVGFQGSCRDFLDFIDELFESPRRAMSRELTITMPDSCRTFLMAGQKYGDERTAVLAGIDITERKEAEAALKESEVRLRQAHKMEAVGVLAGGIAHDFNNLLTVINGFSELLQTQLSPTERQSGMLVQITKAGQRATALTRQLLAISRRQDLQPRVLDLNAVVLDMEKLLRRVLGEDVTFTTALTENLGPIMADPDQLAQVMLNLVANARDAMPTGGTLSVTTSNVELDEAHAKAHGTGRIGPHVKLTVADSGMGMDRETQVRIFEPFFTTKEEGKGTGLGLATIYGIVNQSGGEICVDSELGVGTTFSVYLPRHTEIAASMENDAYDVTLEAGSETVLLVEDDPAVRDLASSALAAAGYTILAASDPTEALEISARHEGPLHLLLTDVVMPTMSGRQLACALLAERPTLNVLYMSGYTPDVAVRHGVVDAQPTYLQKPFTPHALAHGVRRVLDLPAA